jgi:CHAD domain-containing protein
MMARLERLAAQAAKTKESQDEDSIHDFRVSIRRFTQGLILFPDLVPKREVAKVRKRLGKLMKETSEVRNRDIALEHLADSEDEALKERLRQERTAHAAKFAKEIERLVAKNFTSEWRTTLHLDGP